MSSVKRVKISIRQIKAARELLGWSQEKFASLSRVSAPTIRRLEAEGGDLGGRESTQAKIFAAFAKAGIEFTNGNAPGVRLRRR